MRKLLIGFISLVVVLAVFLLYSRLSKTTPIDTGPGAEFIEAATDSNVGGLDSEIGKIGDVGLGPVRKARYITLNKDKEVEREFGFETLLHEERDIWEIEKPYMNIYRSNFKCYITADIGKVRVETAVGRTTPKDATFTSNVVAHILPVGSSSMKESFVYLDDIVFLSEKSLLSTAGSVKFVSEDTQMQGTGLELIYNEKSERLEYFRIIDLESLRIKSSQMTLLSTGEPETEEPVDVESPSDTQQPGETSVADGSQTEEALPAPTQPQDPQKQGQNYKCIFSKNVLIDTPEQLVFADEIVCINDIFWSKTSTGLSDEVDAGPADEKKTTPQATEEDRQSAGETRANEVVSKPGEPNESSEQFVDIVITCDNGLVFAPVDSTGVFDNFVQADIETTTSDGIGPEQLEDETGRTKFFTRRIDYSAPSGDVIAVGPSQLMFYRTDVASADANEAPVPVKVTAREGVKFFKTSNQAVFEGDCLCTIPQTGLTGQKDMTLSAPKIAVNVPEDKTKQPEILANGPMELVFYMEDSNSTDPNKGPIPVKITAQDQALFSGASNQIIFEGDCWCIMPQAGLTQQKDVTLSSPNITLNVPEDRSKQPDIFAAGPTELVFYVEDSNDADTKKEPIPATVTAQEQAYFSAASNQLVFEGDCSFTMLREDPNVFVEYILLSQKIAIDLPGDTNDRTSGPGAGVKHLTASGGVVTLATTKTAKTELTVAEQLSDRSSAKSLGGIELKCSQVDYDPVRGLFVAAGPPAKIQIDNSKISGPGQEAGRFSLSRPCYAFLDNFDILEYSLRENRIVAEAVPQETLWIHYVPIIDGRYDENAIATAKAPHIETLLRQTSEGRTELLTLTATGGIYYEDKDNTFIGSEMFYDHETSTMKIKGDESQPCYYNDVLVDDIELNLETGKVEAQMVTPSTLQMNR